MWSVPIFVLSFLFVVVALQTESDHRGRSPSPLKEGTEVSLAFGRRTPPPSRQLSSGQRSFDGTRSPNRSPFRNELDDLTLLSALGVKSTDATTIAQVKRDSVAKLAVPAKDVEALCKQLYNVRSTIATSRAVLIVVAFDVNTLIREFGQRPWLKNRIFKPVIHYTTPTPDRTLQVYHLQHLDHLTWRADTEVGWMAQIYVDDLSPFFSHGNKFKHIGFESQGMNDGQIPVKFIRVLSSTSGDIRYLMDQQTIQRHDPGNTGATEFAKGMTPDEIAKHVMDSDSDDLMHDPEARQLWMDQVIRGKGSAQGRRVEEVEQQPRSPYQAERVGQQSQLRSPSQAPALAAAEGVLQHSRPVTEFSVDAQQPAILDQHIVRLDQIDQVESPSRLTKCKEKISGRCSVL